MASHCTNKILAPVCLPDIKLTLIPYKHPLPHPMLYTNTFSLSDHISVLNTQLISTVGLGPLLRIWLPLIFAWLALANKTSA